ncbi:MAG: hypothetical protein AAGL24_16460 [Pseudomonadota bacterium]
MKFFAKIFFAEISQRLGQESALSDTPTVKGSRFSDLVIADENTREIQTGAGNDILYSDPKFLGTAASKPQLFDGGNGADTYVLASPETGDDAPETHVIFDTPRGGSGPSGDTIWFPGFLGDRIDVEDLEDGKVLVSSALDPAQSRIVQVKYEDGRPVSFEDIKASIIQPNGEPLVPGGPTLPPTLIHAGDPDADALTFRGSNLSETFVADGRTQNIFAEGGDDRIIFDAEEISDLVIDAGRGNDFIYADLTGVKSAKISGGAGDDVLVLNERAVPPSQVVTFDFKEGNDQLIVRTGDADTSGQARKCVLSLSEDGAGSVTLVLADFGETVEVTNRADGAVVFRDPETGAAFGTFFCDDNGDLTWEELVEHPGFDAGFDWVVPVV